VLAVVVAAVAVLAFTLDLAPPVAPSARPSGASPIVVGGSPLIGHAAPEFTLADLDGTPVRLTGYRGRPVIVNFWASWCIPCRAEFPLLRDARQRHADDGLEVLGIVHDDDAASARAFAEENGAGWPILLDPEDAAWRAYGGLLLPLTFYIDREGVVRTVSFGPPSSGSIDELIAKIL
jgi:cytochrome c biogenesis protein CcmG/thiol:disulfide interchange protein DsbE